MIRYLLLLGVLMLGCTKSSPEATIKVAPETLAQLAKGENQFAVDLYGQLKQTPGNLFFSPASISSALTMTAAGARGTTADAMEKVLRLQMKGNPLHEANAGRLQLWNGVGVANRAYELKVANSLWGQKGKPWQKDFTDITSKFYKASFNEVNFADSEAARKSINDWVAKNTANLIKDLLPPGVLNGLTQMVLCNTIHFKGNWVYAFKEQGTTPSPFYLEPGKSVEVKMMYQTLEFPYFAADNYSVLEMPYSGKELSFVAVLPQFGVPLSKIEDMLSAEQIRKWTDSLANTEVNVGVPRFKLEGEFRLKDQLTNLGMAEAFASGAADFSGMDGTRDLFIGEVVHKAYVEVNEAGTEAAGASGVVMTVKSAPDGPHTPRIAQFHCNRPFLFFIRDKQSGSILFVGRVTDPTK